MSSPCLQRCCLRQESKNLHYSLNDVIHLRGWAEISYTRTKGKVLFHATDDVLNSKVNCKRPGPFFPPSREGSGPRNWEKSLIWLKLKAVPCGKPIDPFLIWVDNVPLLRSSEVQWTPLNTASHFKCLFGKSTIFMQCKTLDIAANFCYYSHFWWEFTV